MESLSFQFTPVDAAREAGANPHAQPTSHRPEAVEALRGAFGAAVTGEESYAGETTVFDAHEICDRLEAALREAVAGIRITIHVEPEHKSKPSGIAVLG